MRAPHSRRGARPELIERDVLTVCFGSRKSQVRILPPRPVLGTVCACMPGDVSGAPALTSQWRRNGGGDRGSHPGHLHTCPGRRWQDAHASDVLLRTPPATPPAPRLASWPSHRERPARPLRLPIPVTRPTAVPSSRSTLGFGVPIRSDADGKIKTLVSQMRQMRVLRVRERSIT